jgi:SpoU rRNA methylase family enzyme
MQGWSICTAVHEIRPVRFFILASVLIAYCGAGCELIVLRNTSSAAKQSAVPMVFNQHSAQGVVRLFVAELDSANLFGALRVLSNENSLMLATEKQELQDDVARYMRIIGGRKITMLRADTLSETKQRIRAELSYTKELTFTAVRLDSLWYIAEITGQ